LRIEGSSSTARANSAVPGLQYRRKFVRRSARGTTHTAVKGSKRHAFYAKPAHKRRNIVSQKFSDPATTVSPKRLAIAMMRRYSRTQSRNEKEP
jgi:hypothetical protein